MRDDARVVDVVAAAAALSDAVAALDADEIEDAAAVLDAVAAFVGGLVDDGVAVDAARVAELQRLFVVANDSAAAAAARLNERAAQHGARQRAARAYL